MNLERCSGVILHPTSLPGGSGIGTLGAPATRFIEWLEAAGQRLWQMCPLGPTGYGNSPYQCFSAFAGNPLLIDLPALQREGWLSEKDLELDSPFSPPFNDRRVDYQRVLPFVWSRLERAHRRFSEVATSSQRADFQRFQEEQAAWLDDYALFRALKTRFGERSWIQWDEPLRLRQPEALKEARQSLSGQITLHAFAQYLFFRQWKELRARAHARGIRIIGDLPIYVAYDSADVWAHRELFVLDAQGAPKLIAGVPPDCFSATGQLWGNPIYDWEKHAQTGYRWWIDVVRAKLAWYDTLRIDHFRGFAAYWAVSAGDTTAERGSWQPGPGAAFFEALSEALGSLPIIAEDLGLITPDVFALRDRFGYPGMKVLQFAFDHEGDNEYRPHTYDPNCVVYTGTHDNDTVRGWYATAKPRDRGYAEEYLGAGPETIAWDFIRAAWASPGIMALAPLQDILALGPEARFNLPGTMGGNWEWRFLDRELTLDLAQRLKHLGDTYARADDPLKKPRPSFTSQEFRRGGGLSETARAAAMMVSR